MRTNHTDSLTIKITPNDKGNPPGKLADAELHFAGDSPLAGLKLIGFSIWERRGGNGRNVTFPARSYAVNGERRSFALLRPIVDATAQEACVIASSRLMRSTKSSRRQPEFDALRRSAFALRRHSTARRRARVLEAAGDDGQ